MGINDKLNEKNEKLTEELEAKISRIIQLQSENDKLRSV